MKNFENSKGFKDMAFFSLFESLLNDTLFKRGLKKSVISQCNLAECDKTVTIVGTRFVSAARTGEEG